MTRRRHAPFAALLLTTALLGAAAGAGGCQVLGVAASKLPPPTVPAAYDALAGHPVAVWVWVDPAAALDYPYLSRELAAAVQKRLEIARDDGDKGERRVTEGVTFPYPPESFARYQKENPTLGALPATELAKRIGTDRLIYIEIGRFTTRGGAVSGLNRGVAELSVQVVEVADATPTPATRPAEKTARVAFTEAGIKVSYPTKGAPEGTNRIGVEKIYQGTLFEMAKAVGDRLLPHSSEE